MSLDNPYDYQPSDASTSAAGIDPAVHGILEELRMTRPWVRLMGFLGILGSLLAFIAAGVMTVGGLAGGANGVPLIIGGIVYALVGCLYAYPFWKLLNYASAIRQAEDTGGLRDVEVALSHQRSFWRFLGILTAIALGFWLLSLVVLMFFGFAV
ncbi:MAG: hypothetical protein AB8G99_01850 [Planctomycetaceae bacterium]